MDTRGFAHERQVTLKDVGDDPDCGRVADLDDRLATFLHGHADCRAAVDDAAADRGSNDDACAGAHADEGHVSLDAHQFSLELRYPCFGDNPVAFGADALLLHP